MRFEIWFPVFTLVLGGLLVMGQSWIENRWGRKERRESQREQFQYEKLTDLLSVAARWHAIVDRHYWGCVTVFDQSGRWPVGPNQEPIDASDRSEYNQLWTELQVLSFLIHDQDLREDIDALRDAASQTIESVDRNSGTIAYQRETEAYLAVARRIGQLLSADLSK
ncbi:MAG TPA: hypothetical protein VFP05_01810 [Thermomicrobiales bacterium]|nr:hypothetical protein [Thermomicrobiales bacterium]